MNLDLLRDAVTIFLGIFVEAFPFLLIGVLASSLLHVFVKKEHILRLFPKNPILSLLIAPLLGFLFPVCECGNIPFARSLMEKGMKPSSALSFLLAAPVCNPIVIIATLTAFRLEPHMALLRVIGTLLIAYGIGLLFHRFAAKDLLSKGMMNACETGHDEHEHREAKGAHFVKQVYKEGIEMGGVLVLGAAIAASIQLLWSRDVILSIGTNPLLAIVALLLLAAIISICSTVDSFFALSFKGTFPFASILGFLVFGPMIDIKSIAMLLRIFKARIVVYLVLLCFLLSFLFALLVHLFL